MDGQALTREQLINAVNLVATMVISQLAEETGASPTDTLLSFMQSRTALCLYDTETALWCDGPQAVIAEYKKEIQ